MRACWRERAPSLGRPRGRLKRRALRRPGGVRRGPVSPAGPEAGVPQRRRYGRYSLHSSADESERARRWLASERAIDTKISVHRQPRLFANLFAPHSSLLPTLRQNNHRRRVRRGRTSGYRDAHRPPVSRFSRSSLARRSASSTAQPHPLIPAHHGSSCYQRAGKKPAEFAPPGETPPILRSVTSFRAPMEDKRFRGYASRACR
jgi:hypothetical protein